jgi:hypothetical protein
MAANLGQVLLQEQLLNEEQIQTVTEYKAENHIHFGEACVKLGFINREQLYDVLGLQMNLPRINLNYLALNLMHYV